jgi:glycine/D-amino acid oxidase-like deaminating enzyme/nitrite reductase/ring-hydroxylating ferredoxin subunit
MKAESGTTVSLWAATADVPQFKPLEHDIYAEVCIIGGGLAGLTTAYLAAQKGLAVVVLDDNDICGGETARTTAHLSNVIDDKYSELVKKLGVHKTSLARQAHTAAINEIQRIAVAEHIDCDFRWVPGYLFCGPKQNPKDLQKEFEAGQMISFNGIEMLKSTPFGVALPNDFPCIRYPNQAQFHVLKYLSGLAKAISRLSGRIFTYTHVSAIKDGKPAVVTTACGAKVLAQWVVVATNSPISDYMQVYTKEAAWRTYALAGRVDRGYVDEALFWDLADPYHYIRTQPIEHGNHEWLIVGGEDHRTGHETDSAVHLAALEDYTRQIFSAVRDVQLHWSGQIMETVDGLALIGRDPERGDNILIYSGDSGMGMTHGTIAGMLLRDMVLGKDNPWSTIFDPRRSGGLRAPLQAARGAYDIARGYVAKSDVHSLDELAPGTGAVIDHKGKKIAAYRDYNNEVCQLSAICPHMKAVLQWNNCEQTWDCPAHGSRFSANGEVVNGPAISNMFKLADDARLPEPSNEPGVETEADIFGQMQVPPPEQTGDEPWQGI